MSTTTDNEDPNWAELSDPAVVADALCDLYRRRGTATYEERVNQADHARQAGALALQAGAASTTVVAAFLHDVGHLLMSEYDENGNEILHDRYHEDIGADLLSQWFDDDVVTPIRLHVPAKRYLCAVEPTYHDGLTPASVKTLRLQGGPMTADEVAAFESVSQHPLAVQLRRWDDGAKTVDADAPSLDHFRDLIFDVLRS